MKYRRTAFKNFNFGAFICTYSEGFYAKRITGCANCTTFSQRWVQDEQIFSNKWGMILINRNESWMKYSLQTVTFWNLVSLLIWRGLCVGENFKEITAAPRTFEILCPWVYGGMQCCGITSVFSGVYRWEDFYSPCTFQISCPWISEDNHYTTAN